MKKIILIMLLTIASFADYIEGSVIGVPSKSNVQDAPVIFMNTVTPTGATVNTWTKIDLTGIVPTGTKAVRLDGNLLITHGTTAEIADLMVHFRKTGETYNYSYNMQVIEASTGDGQRSIGGLWIALDDNLCFDYKWNVPYLGTYPSYSAYGINLSLTAYLR